MIHSCGLHSLFILRFEFGRVTAYPEYVADLGGGNTAVLGSFISFFLVFLVNQTNSRYFGLYGKSMACKGRIFDTASLVVVCLPKPVATRLIRYMNAAHVAGYTGLSKTYPASSFFAHLNKDLGLLTDEEFARMKEIDLDVGGSCQRELIAWCIQEIQTCHKYQMIDNDLAAQLRDADTTDESSLWSTEQCGRSSHSILLHALCMLIKCTLPSTLCHFCRGVSWNRSRYVLDFRRGGRISRFTSIRLFHWFENSFTENGRPYGDDLVDLSVIFYCTFTWRMSNRILNAKFPPEEASEAVEEQLIQDRDESIGKAFESNGNADTESDSGFEDGTRWCRRGRIANQSARRRNG